MHGAEIALIAQFFDRLGIDFSLSEDSAVLTLHREILKRACPPERGVSDWGWTESERLDERAVAAGFEPAAELATRHRARTQGPWGFAEPRGTVLLDLWSQVLPDSVFLLAYDAPWDDVSFSLASRHPQLTPRPDYAARAWLGYARRLLAFARRHPQRCALVNCEALRADPVRLATTAADLLGAAAPPALTNADAIAANAAAITAAMRARSDAAGPLARMVAATAHKVPGTYLELEERADLPCAAEAGPGDADAEAVGALAAYLFAERDRNRALELDLKLPARAGTVGPAAAARRVARVKLERWRREKSNDATLGGAAPPAAAADATEAPAAPAPDGPAARWFHEHYGEAATHTLAFLEAGGVSFENKDVADIGSGDGIIDLALAHRGRPRLLVGYDVRCTDRDHLTAQAALYGVDPVPPELEFKASQPRRVPAEDDSFDIVVTWSAFEHISDPVSVASEMRRVLRPGGVLFLQLWPFHRSERGSHLWDWFPQPFHHLLEHEDDIVNRMLDSDVHDRGFTSYMAEEFRRLNRVTLEELHRALLAGGFRVARLELMTGTIQIPPALSRYALTDLAVSGVKLLAI